MVLLLLILSFCASLFSIVAYNVMTIGRIKLSKCVFFAGILLYIVSLVLDNSSVVFGPQTLKATTASAPILLNFFISRLFLVPPKQQPFFQNLFVIIFLTGGLVLSAISFIYSPKVIYSPSSVNELVTSIISIAYICSFLFSSVLFVFFTYRVQPGLPKIIFTGVGAGVFASLSSLAAKTTIHLFSSSEYLQIMAYFFWLWLFTYFMQLVYVGYAIYKFTDCVSVQLFMLIYTIIYITATMISGGVVYEEFISFRVKQWIQFSIGFAITTIGVLSWFFVNRNCM